MVQIWLVTRLAEWYTSDSRERANRRAIFLSKTGYQTKSHLAEGDPFFLLYIIVVVKIADSLELTLIFTTLTRVKNR